MALKKKGPARRRTKERGINKPTDLNWIEHLNTAAGHTMKQIKKKQAQRRREGLQALDDDGCK